MGLVGNQHYLSGYLKIPWANVKIVVLGVWAWGCFAEICTIGVGFIQGLIEIFFRTLAMFIF